MNKFKIIALIGEAGSGKDSIMKTMLQTIPDLHEIISCTTRPRRDYEVDGVDYHFLSAEEFTIKLLKDEMLEGTIFNNWCYGTSQDALDENKVNIGVFNPAGIEILQNNPKIDLRVFYIDVEPKKRIIRQLNREEKPNIEEIFRRYKTDKEDFIDIDEQFNPYHIYNNGSGTQYAADKIIELCTDWLLQDISS